MSSIAKSESFTSPPTPKTEPETETTKTTNVPYIVVVDGIISAGKSTYIETIATGLPSKGWRVTVVKEPVDKWNETGILKRFYKDPKRWAYHFQTKAFHDRVVENVEQFEKFGSSSDLFLLERSPFTDTLFMEILHEAGDIDDLEMKDYREWWKLWYKIMPYQPNLFIYLKPDLEQCMNRLHIRNRDGEQGVSADYQRHLENKHDIFFKSDKIQLTDTTEAECITLRTNENFKDDPVVKERMVADFDVLLKRNLATKRLIQDEILLEKSGVKRDDFLYIAANSDYSGEEERLGGFSCSRQWYIDQQIKHPNNFYRIVNGKDTSMVMNYVRDSTIFSNEDAKIWTGESLVALIKKVMADHKLKQCDCYLAK